MGNRLTEKITCRGKATYRISNAEKESKALTKLGQLEDIEEELSIDLITLFKALKNGVYVKNIRYSNIFLVEDLELGYEIINGKKQLGFGIGIKLADYGKTWALTKEELEGK